MEHLPSHRQTSLRLYLDTADRSHWEQWLSFGLFYGITTNPLLLEKAQVPCTPESLTSLAQAALGLGAQEVQLQTWGTTVEMLVDTGKALAAIDDRVVVKAPITRLGADAAAQLLAAGVRVTLTGIYAPHQVLIAAALGADYAAPYLGRISDLGHNGREELAQMQQILAGVRCSTRILAASIRSVGDLAFLASRGLDTFTISAEIAADLFAVDATLRAAEDFQRAAEIMGARGSHS